MAKSPRHNKSARTAANATARAVELDATTRTEAEPNQRALLLLVLVPVLFNAIMLWPELSGGVPTRNDSAFHLLMIRSASSALASGQNVLDFWIPQLDLGFPQFLYYQNLPHLAVVGIHRLLFQTVQLETIFNATRYVLLVAFPITVYASMRRMGFSIAAASLSASASSLIASDAHMGFEYNSYLWRGFGLFAQLWAMHLAFIAMAFLYSAMRDGKGYVTAIISIAALALSHLIFAFMIAITSVIMYVVMWKRGTQLSRLVRLAVIGITSIALSCYMLVPFALSSGKYMSTSPWVAARAHYVAIASRWYLRGTLLDFNRWPVLTLLSLAGAVAAVAMLRKSKNESTKLALTGFIVWSVLYFAHPTVGPLARLFPAHDGWITARFVSSFEIFAILIIGASGQWLWELLRRWPSSANRFSERYRVFIAPAMYVSIALLVLSPAFVERSGYYAGNSRLIAGTQRAFVADTDLHAVLDTINTDPNGRVYAGNNANWGASMTVGPTVRVNDVVRFAGMSEVGVPYQALSLSTSLFNLFREGDIDSFDLLDVRWAIVPASATVPPFYEAALRTGKYTLYRIKTSGIAEYVGITVPATVYSQKALFDATVAWYASDAIVSRKVVAWNYMSSQQTVDPSTTFANRCKNGGDLHIQKSAQGYLALTAQCDSASALMLKFTYHPNWRVTVDGVSTPTIMVSPAFLAFKLPAGRHTVVAQYVATPMKLPLFILGLVALVATLYFRDRLDVVSSRVASRFT